MVINNNKNINSINPCKVRLPNSKIFNIKGTDFKYKIHYDQLNDTALLRIEEQVNYIFNAYKKRYTLPVDADVTFEGYIYNNLEEYFYAYPQHQRIPGGGYIGGHSIGLSQYMPYEDHMQSLLAHEIAHSLNYYNLNNHNIPILKCSHEGHDDATDFGNEVGTEISLLSQARQSEYDRKLSTAVQSEDISEVTDFLNQDDSGKTPFEIALEHQKIGLARFLANAKDKYGKTTLHYAAEDNDLNLVRLLIGKGADINAKDDRGQTPLHTANGKDMAKLLIDKGADINAKDDRGQTPLHTANGKDMAKLLIDKGADINAEDDHGQTPLHTANGEDIARLLIDKGADIYAKDDHGRTPLHTANGKDIAKFLIDKGANVNAEDDHEQTPLHIANGKDIANLLIDQGALIHARDNRGRTPLHTANGKDMAKLLIDRYADVNVEDDHGQTPIEIALEYKKTEVVNFLATVKDKYDHTTLHYAAEDNDLNLVRLLIGKGADINAKDDRGQTPLHTANGRDMAKLLIDKGADINVKDDHGQTPLHTANGKDMAKLLIDKGADINAKDDRGQTPLHTANGKDMAKLLIDKGADINAKDDRGQTPLHTANGEDIARLLIDKGADIYAKDDHGRTPLHTATDESIARLLIDKGANVNAEDDHGQTPLHTANGEDIAKLLIDKGADINARDDHGKVPFEIVLEHGKKEVVNFLATAKDKNNNTVLHYAFEENNYSIVFVLLNRGADIDSKNKDGNTPLLLAAKRGSLGIVRSVVGSKFRPDISVKDKDGNTALKIALKYNQAEMAEVLQTVEDNYRDRLFRAIRFHNFDEAKYFLSRGVNINAKGKYHYTPLETAIDESTANFLVDEGADINAKGDYGQTPLHNVNSRSVARVLIDKGADINAKDDRGQTPLYTALCTAHIRIAIFLINSGADLEAKDNNGRVSLHFAVECCCLHIVDLLIRKGASLNFKGNPGQTPFEIALKYQNPEVINLLANAKDKYSKTILHYAAEDNNLNLVRLLVENGANISAKDKNGKTPIGIAIDQRHDSVAVYLQQTQLGLNTQLLVAVLGNDFNKVKDLVSKGASVDTKDNNGWTLLHHTAKRGYLEVAEFLIEKGADINAEDKYGKKPIQRAAEENNTNIITLLLSKGVNIDDTDRNGRTSLYWAAWNGNLDAVKYLVGKDASIQAGDKDGKTALDIARDKGYNDVVNYLEEELNKEREKPVQRRRRRHHGDHVRHHMSRKPLAIDSSNQPEIAVSSSTKPSSRINDCISWVKKLAASTFSIIPRLPAQYKIADKNNVKSDNKNIPQSTSSVGWNKFLNNENIALASCVADALDNTPSRRYQDLMSKGVEVVPSRRVAVEFALENFNSFVEDKIRNLDSKEQARIRVELKGAYPEITASLERGVEFSGNIGLDNVLEKCKKCFCTNVLPKDKVSTCLSEIGVTKLGGNLNR